MQSRPNECPCGDFYKTTAYDDETCVYTYEARPLADAKQTQLDINNNWTASLLGSTDFYVIRKADIGTAVPDDVAAYRSAVRTASNQRQAQIEGVETLDALIALIQAPSNIADIDTKVISQNPDGLTMWPENPFTN